MMLRGIAVAALFAAAACGPGETPPPPAKTEGQLAREKIDVLTKRFGDCVLGAAGKMTQMDAVGPMVDAALKACPEEREALRKDVAAFYTMGHANVTPAYAERVSEASVKDLESSLREEVAVALLNRPDVKAN